MAATDPRHRPAAPATLAHGATHRAAPGRRWLALLAGLFSSVFGGLFGSLLGGLFHSARAADLPDDRAEALFHLYDGGGVRASGPALLVRKSLARDVALSGSYYVDAVSNASIDVVTTASPFREKREEWGLGVDVVVRDSLLRLSASRSSEPDYLAQSLALDVSQEVFGGMTTVSFGFGQGHDDVGQKNISGPIDQARHWQYRFGATQVLSPRLLASLNFEALADAGYLGNPYRVARVYDAAVPERMPRTRSARALKARLLGDLGGDGERAALHGDYRYYWDNWDIQAHTLELGYSRHLGPALLDAFVRHHRQGQALFYSDNASAETTYVSRNRQLSQFHSVSLGLRGTWTLGQGSAWPLQLQAGWEHVRFRYDNFTDLRTGRPYAFNGNLLQCQLTANF